jgi:branched-chain amino acid transport system permease protein
MFERLDLLVDNPTIAFIQFMNGLSRGMVLFVISAGLTMIFGVLRILNFAHGAFYMIGGYAMYSAVRFFADIPGGFWLAAIAAGLFMAAIAFVIETLLLRRLYGREMLYQLLFTFALVLLLVDFVRAIWGAQLYRVPYPRELMGRSTSASAHIRPICCFLSSSVQWRRLFLPSLSIAPGSAG